MNFCAIRPTWRNWSIYISISVRVCCQSNTASTIPDYTITIQRLSSLKLINMTTTHYCQYCDYKVNKKVALRIHVNAVHLNLRPFKCETCPKAFKAKKVLIIHRRDVHGENVGPTEKFPCTKCDYAASTSHILKRHLETHNETKAYSCFRENEYGCWRCEKRKTIM